MLTSKATMLTLLSSLPIRFRREKEEYWAEDLTEDVQEEAGNYGDVQHVHVDQASTDVCHP